MAEWNSAFEEVIKRIEENTRRVGELTEPQKVCNLLWAFTYSWTNDQDVLVWVCSEPEDKIFGTNVLFVNSLVLSELGWTFDEWTSGVAENDIFHPDEYERLYAHVDIKSSLRILTYVKQKGQGEYEGDPYYLTVFHSLPNGLRLVVAVPKGA